MTHHDAMENSHEPGGIVPDPATSLPGWREGMPLIRLFACGPFTIEVLQDMPAGDPAQARYAPLPPERLHGRGPAPALTFLKLLTSQRDRYAPKDWLIEHLHADEYLITPRRLENIVSFVRHLLSLPDGTKPFGMLRYVRASHESGDGYRLAPYPLIWFDVEALAHHVRQACLLERFGDDALPSWERAYQLASRGTYLAEEPYSEWAEVRREEVEGHLRQCVHALARLWLARYGPAGEEEVLRLLRTYWQQPPTDEDALCPLLKLLARRQCYQEGLEYYAHFVQSLEEQGLTKDGKPRLPDQRTRDLADYLRLKERQPLLSRPSQRESTRPSSAGMLVQRDGMALTGQEGMLALFSSAIKQGILQAAGELEGDIMDRLRRQLVGQVLTGTGAALLTSYTTAPHIDILERLAKVLSGPSHVDETTLTYLERRTASYWQDRHQAVIASPDLLGYVLEHLEKIITLLEQSLLPQERLRLCALASQTAQLAGHLLFDMSAYSEARRFHTTAIHAAHEAGDAALEATAWARMSFTWTYSGHAKEAFSCIHRASALASGKINATALAYLAAVEAEIQALLGEQTACLDKLNEAERQLREAHPKEDTCWLRFDHSRLAGYQGICFQRLYRREDPQTASFLMHAQTALQDALERLSPALIQRRPALLIDLAGTYTRQGEIEGACKQVIQAFEVIELTKSQAVIQRLLQLRQALEPWKQTAYVKQVDERMEALLVPNSLPQGIQER